MSVAPVVHICGWPGCGKRTIGRIVAARMGARLIDNHLVLNPASALFERGTPERSRLRERMRAVIHEAALDLPTDIPLVLTDALASSDADHPVATSTLAFARAREAVLVPVVLNIEAGGEPAQADRSGTRGHREADRRIRPGGPAFDARSATLPGRDRRGRHAS